VLLAVIILNVSATGVISYKLLKVSRENRELREKLEKQEAKPKRLPKTIDYEILELYRKGYSLREIARQLGVSHTTVARRLKRISQALGDLDTLDTGIHESLVKKEEAELEA